MDQNQINEEQTNENVIVEEKQDDIFIKKGDTNSKLPLLSVIFSGITLFLTIVILVILIVSFQRTPSFGGMKIDAIPNGQPPFGQQDSAREKQDGSINSSGERSDKGKGTGSEKGIIDNKPDSGNDAGSEKGINDNTSDSGNGSEN